ncbi:MAG: rhomboid family intramembrane serine protease, partial [Planctomycetes bacterium]|nr:rhomboid family intramembrane serine protease [Planctomycetota bacterium]
KLGNFGYLCFYAAGAVFSGLGHMFFSGTPVLGASGAVAAVTGAYLVLFSKTEITVMYWFFFLGTFDLPAYYFIGLKMILFDNMIASTDQRVAYDAHLAGYAFGIAATLFLLIRGLIRRENFDLLYMMTQWNRRRRYRDAVSDGYDPFSGRVSQQQTRVKRKKGTQAEHAEIEKTAEIRGEIAQLISQRNLPQAAKLYENLLNIDPDQVLPRQHQLDIANQLMSMGQWAMSAQAYERFLAHYRNYEHIEQVELMLGVLLCRYLDKPTEAAGLLRAAREKLTDPGQLKMCDDELKRLENSGS